MRFGSVCSGIEAASVAFNPLGWEAAWFAEIEAFPSAVLAHHYPEVENLGDMTKIADLVNNLLVEAPDMLCGGTPCQAFSVAGLRNSLDDARGNLSLTFCEIANAIDTTRLLWKQPPAIIFWENVPGVLSTKDNAFGCFLAGLAGEDEALVPSGGKWTDAGYVHGPQRTVAWRILDAQYFGLAQRRRRVFVVASAREGFDPAKVLFEFDSLRRDSAPSREARQEVTGTIEASIGSSRGAGTPTSILKEWPADVAQTLDCSYADKQGMDNQHINGGGLCLSKCLTAGTGQRYDPETETLIPTHGGRFVNAPPFDTTQITSQQNGSNPHYGDPCHPLAAQAHVPAIAFSRNDDGSDSTTELSPTIRVAGHADGMMAVAFTGGVDYENNGHEANEPTGPLLKGSPSGGGHQLPAISLPNMQVRRLTPVECARLQGFPDDYLNITYRKKPAADGPKYKALGNSWAVPVVRWIGERIAKELV